MLMARSGNLILDALYNNAISTELVTSRMPQTRIGLLFSVIAGEWEGWEMVLDNYKNEGFLATAKIMDNVEKLAAPLYLRSSERHSDAIIKITWKTGVERTDDVSIPFGTIIQTQDRSPIQYSTVERVTLYRTASVCYVRARSIETGAKTRVSETALNELVPNISQVNAYNPQPSWGGRDKEPIENVRQNALSSRYMYEKGTKDHILLSLANIGLKQNEFNLYEHAFGYGTFAIYLNTTIDEQIREVVSLVDDIRAEGIYSECAQTFPIESTVLLSVKISDDKQMTPERYTFLSNSLKEAVLQYIEDNGVGQKIYINKFSNYLIGQFRDKGLYDAEISFETYALRDASGNVDLYPYEVLNITDVSVWINLG
jgi:hypothetical protein